LAQTQANIIRAKNGQEMVDIIKSQRNVDIVLLDMGMPVMDGYDATKLLRNEGFQVPIIAQTAFALNNEKERVLEVGCNDYVEKPINKEVLFEKIDKLIN
jgi:CheY-like chemotaxis protein